MSNKQLDKLIKNIRAEGIKDPLTVTEFENRLYILDGHHRALAAPRAGVAQVPINRVKLPFGAYKTPADLTFTPGDWGHCLSRRDSQALSMLRIAAH